MPWKLAGSAAKARSLSPQRAVARREGVEEGGHRATLVAQGGPALEPRAEPGVEGEVVLEEEEPGGFFHRARPRPRPRWVADLTGARTRTSTRTSTRTIFCAGGAEHLREGRRDAVQAARVAPRDFGRGLAVEARARFSPVGRIPAAEGLGAARGAFGTGEEVRGDQGCQGRLSRGGDCAEGGVR